ncbi:MAG: hypothetical protein R2726_18040 [Acidimicrobiales bacterium]
MLPPARAVVAVVPPEPLLVEVSELEQAAPTKAMPATAAATA